MTRLRLAACIAAILHAWPAAAGDLLAMLDGRWTGSGWSRAVADAPRESLRCKLVVTVSPRGSRIDIRGKCAVPGKSYDLRSFIARKADGTYEGQWSNPGGEGAADLTGRRDGDRLVLHYDGRHPDTARRVEGTMTWTIGADSFVLSNTVTDVAAAKTWQAGAMTFAR